MKRAALSGSALFISVFLICSKVMAQNYDTLKYFPLDVGNEWIYAARLSGKNRINDDIFKETSVVKAREVFDGAKVYVFMPAEEDESKIAFYYSRDKYGVYLYKLCKEDTSVVFTPPLLVIPGSMRPAEKYGATSSAKVYSAAGDKLGENIADSTVSLEAIEDVVVPAGRFNKCLKISSSWHIPTKDGVVTLMSIIWLAPDVGIVKQKEQKYRGEKNEEKDYYVLKELKKVKLK